MISDELKKIVDGLSKQGKTVFSEAATKEQIVLKRRWTR